jgi:hypothetical protein
VKDRVVDPAASFLFEDHETRVRFERDGTPEVILDATGGPRWPGLKRVESAFPYR